LYEYDHIVPWAQVKEHTPENLVLLCDRHHREKTNGLLPAEQVEEASRAPFNLRSGESAAYELHYAGGGCQTILGSNVHVWPDLLEGWSTVPLMIDDIPIVIFRVEDGRLLMSLQLLAEDNHLVAQVVDNELVFSMSPWDVQFEGRRLTIRDAPRDIFVDVAFEPPQRVVIDRGRLWANGIQIEFSPEAMVVGGNIRFSKNSAVALVGIVAGDVPRGLPYGFATGPSGRAPGAGVATDERLIRLGTPAPAASSPHPGPS
jgi:trigger factor